MEREAENPFRPDGELSHIVEPIVDAYKTKPFPEVDEMAAGVVALSYEETNTSAPLPPAKKSSKGRQQQTEDAMVATRQVELHMSAAPDGAGNTQQMQVTKAGKVELVHLEEKKRRCGCCVVQ